MPTFPCSRGTNRTKLGSRRRWRLWRSHQGPSPLGAGLARLRRCLPGCSLEACKIPLSVALNSGNRWFCQLPQFRHCTVGYGATLVCAFFSENARNIKTKKCSVRMFGKLAHKTAFHSGPPLWFLSCPSPFPFLEPVFSLTAASSTESLWGSSVASQAGEARGSEQRLSPRRPSPPQRPKLLCAHLVKRKSPSASRSTLPLRVHAQSHRVIFIAEQTVA